LATVINRKLSEENLSLSKELKNLKDKLNINSSNSGLPTSKEIYKRKKSSRPKSERKPGGQPGHKSNFYQSKAPDEIVDILPEEKQCICGGDLAIEEGFESYQKIEIPPIKPFVTEYRIHNCICKICSKKYRSGSSVEIQTVFGRTTKTLIRISEKTDYNFPTDLIFFMSRRSTTRK
jgi:transposase